MYASIFKFNPHHDERGRFTSRGNSASGVPQTETKDFKEWFGKSTVVDEQGNPMVVYHATGATFQDFSPGTHFGTEEAAKHRAMTKGWEDDDRGIKRQYHLVPVYVKLENPLRLPDIGNYDAGTGLSEKEFYAQRFTDFFRSEWNRGSDLSLLLLTQKIITREERQAAQKFKDVISLLKKKGYDGIVYKNTAEDIGKDSYMIFDSSQVRIAEGRERTVLKFNPNHDERGRFTSKDRSASNPSGTQLPARVDLNAIRSLPGHGEYRPDAAQSVLGIPEKFDGTIRDSRDLSRAEIASCRAQVSGMFRTLQKALFDDLEMSSDEERNIHVAVSALHLASIALEKIQTYRTGPKEKVLLALGKEGEVRGVLFAKITEGHELKIETLSSFQRGAGRSLLEQCEDWGLRNGATSVSLESTPYAKAFYERRGYSRYGSEYQGIFYQKKFDVSRKAEDEDDDEPLWVLALPDDRGADMKIEKANPYHDERGQFTSKDNASGGGAALFSAVAARTKFKKDTEGNYVVVFDGETLGVLKRSGSYDLALRREVSGSSGWAARFHYRGKLISVDESTLKDAKDRVVLKLGGVLSGVVEKANPYHDERGRFTSKDKASSNQLADLDPRFLPTKDIPSFFDTFGETPHLGYDYFFGKKGSISTADVVGALSKKLSPDHKTWSETPEGVASNFFTLEGTGAEAKFTTEVNSFLSEKGFSRKGSTHTNDDLFVHEKGELAALVDYGGYDAMSGNPIVRVTIGPRKCFADVERAILNESLFQRIFKHPSGALAAKLIARRG